jgi:chloramphenicol-sensitive protein RarD
MQNTDKPAKRELAVGTFYGFFAYLLWGFFPVYWKQLSGVGSLQILAHRIVWAAVFSCLLVLAQRKTASLREVLKSPRKAGAIVLAGLLVTVNWGVYIWAVNSSHIVESSLGYYLSPLFVVLTGNFFLKEKIDRGLWISLGIALVGVIVLTVDYGRIPWIALALSISWTAYSYVKKRASLDPLAGFALETLSVTPLALAFLIWQHASGHGSFVNAGPSITALLVLAGPVTALPLLLYAAGVIRIPLSRMGPLQYVSPTLQLGLGVLIYGEPFGGVRAVAFAFIAVSLVAFALTRGSRNARIR